jgi:hypothetical protein
MIDAYMAMLDGALLDRQISESEADGLLDLAHDLVSRATTLWTVGTACRLDRGEGLRAEWVCLTHPRGLRRCPDARSREGWCSSPAQPWDLGGRPRFTGDGSGSPPSSGWDRSAQSVSLVARTTVYGRRLIIERWQGGWPAAVRPGHS